MRFDDDGGHDDHDDHDDDDDGRRHSHLWQLRPRAPPPLLRGRWRSWHDPPAAVRDVEGPQSCFVSFVYNFSASLLAARVVSIDLRIGDVVDERARSRGQAIGMVCSSVNNNNLQAEAWGSPGWASGSAAPRPPATPPPPRVVRAARGRRPRSRDRPRGSAGSAEAEATVSKDGGVNGWLSYR